jgi:single-strand DNA-binding protein
MSGVNKAILLGRLGKDPEIKYTPSGKSMVTFSLATSEKWGEEERTEWHKIVMYDRVAELANQYLRKGDQVYLEGRIQYRTWEDKTGVKRYSTDIVCNNMHLLGTRRDSAAQKAELPPQEGPPVTYELKPQPKDSPAEASVVPPDLDEPLPDDDDMPF